MEFNCTGARAVLMFKMLIFSAECTLEHLLSAPHRISRRNAGYAMHAAEIYSLSTIAQSMP